VRVFPNSDPVCVANLARSGSFRLTGKLASGDCIPSGPGAEEYTLLM